jgi:hypothetical protein
VARTERFLLALWGRSGKRSAIRICEPEYRPGSQSASRRWPVERSNAWVLENKRLALRYDRLGFIIQSLLQAACIFLVAGRVTWNCKYCL